MQYLAYHFTINPVQPGAEILMAELSQLHFESFEEHPHGISAYVQEELAPTNFDSIQILKNPNFEIDYKIEQIEQINWNEEWEKNFHPIEVDDLVYIRAPFHDTKENFLHEIIIEPKMSFGTGHHETTFQMIQFIFDEDCKEKKVLDMGCGTGVLGIVAQLNQAKKVDYIDIDDWCVENTTENLERNNCQGKVFLGGAEQIKNEYQLILANINRNVLVADLPIYAKHLSKNGSLLLSGFYEEDLDIIKENCQNNGLQYVKHSKKKQWIACKFVKG